MYLASRGAAVDRLKEMGKEVFLDLKFHDIPNTVAQACRQAAGLGAAICNVHAAGGSSMLREAARALNEEAARLGVKRPLLIAVTILTSMNSSELAQVMGQQELPETVTRLARLAQEAGLDGVVASPQEIKIIRTACGADFKIICPGVRPEWAAAGDQKRVMTPSEAVAKGSSYLVIGRPIIAAEDPKAAAQAIAREIG
jgi:orotidine-5'-phosphate decarboxylase